MSVVRVQVTVVEYDPDDPSIQRTVAQRQITYFDTQPYTVKTTTPDGDDWSQSLTAGEKA